LELKSRSRRLSRQMERKGAKLSLIVVDYLQLLTAPTSKERDNRAQEVAEISRGLKALAKELNVPVLALSQLNRNIATKDGRGREPQLSDLRESGAIEQDADIVIFLHEEKNEEQEYGAPPEEGTPVRLILGKHRNGPVGRIDLQFHKQFSRFAEVARGGDSGRAESDF
ncbi:MAG: DnaB-like helicase C-terminal domain-containing protein, partial [Gammaproteobacteria bacterium]